ncbi:GNAT family N-acetyltransferase [Bacillus sp. CH30_1T]|uniref:GNAT family N-acetyltransferase n=1 Tax=Bacillus sp. CH30_1T TaxID=2604836 RepID=UPI00165E3F27|nr:GNAT family N-acetyltransferase [Bacillus sp. CH30_1T]
MGKWILYQMGKGEKTMRFILDEEVYEITQAKNEDLRKVLDLLVNAATWLKTKSTKQWSYYLTDLDGNEEEVLHSIENGATYLVEKEGQPISTLTLENNPSGWDLDLWGENARDDVVYLHRLVVHRNHAGKGIGAALLDWVEKEAQEAGKKIIRFDCIASNEGLNHYYQKRYPLKEVVDIHGRHSKYEIIL